ncbi:MAG: T9SS type A sorting domain-containing protein [Bacteroidia bacterium]|nr:T9SS type A sorting domain-containing protein [Bacteroidia bacterium]
MKIQILIITFLLTVFQAAAQLSGTYTIGGVSPDYATVNAAAIALNATGISGPVTFNIRNGTYTGKVILNNIPNSSAVNTVLFQSEDADSTVVILEDSSTIASANNFVLQLNGADWVTFKQMTFRRTGVAAYGSVVNVTNGSTNNSFLNNQFVGTMATTSSVNSSLLQSAAGTLSNDSNTVIRNNLFLNGSYGINFLGASTTILESGTIVENNILQGNYGRGIYLGNQNSPIIANNQVITSTTYATFYAMYFSSCDNNMIIRNNKVSSPSGGGGMYFTGCEGAAGLPINVYNNFIHAGGAATCYGMYFTTSTDMNIWHNSIHVTGTAAISRCFNATGAGVIKLAVQNNVLANTGGGQTFYIVTAALPGLSVSNYNNLYSTGANIAFWDAALVPTLADWKIASGKDANSVSANPVFASNTDLHAFSSGMNDAGIHLVGVTTDIDGEVRSVTTPDIGADEFTPLTDNLVVNALVAPAALGSCGQPAVSLEVSVGNLGSNSQSSIPIVVEITGALTSTILDTIPGPITLNSSVTHVINQTIATTGGGEYFFKIYSSLASDQFRSNDTIQAKRVYYTIPNSPTAVSPQQGCNTSVGITATPDSGDIIMWYDALTGGNLVGIGNPLTVPINADTVFYAESRTGTGTSGCLRIVECGVDASDYIEIQNLSGTSFDATGWSVAISNNYSQINTVNANIWALGNFGPNEIQYKSDATADNYWGSNMLFNPNNTGWVVLLDGGNNVVDFLAFGWSDADIQGMSPIINGVPITIGTQWSGNGVIACTGNTISRSGNSDNNNGTDFPCEPGTKGVQNANMSVAFANCGVGICGSDRIPVQVTMVTGVSTSLGPDTAFSSPFSYVIDAGAGFVSYLWSDSSTSQTLTVTAAGIYWVTVSGANGCSFTDSVEVTITTGIRLVSDIDRIQGFPNPANDKVTIQYTGKDADARIVDVNGRVIATKSMSGGSGVVSSTFDLSDVESGLYFIQVQNQEEVLTMKLIIQHP